MTEVSAQHQHGGERLRIRVRGAVQGVGFRPHAHELARRHALSGFVLNDCEGVLIEVEGRAASAYPAALRTEAPPLARIDSLEVEPIPPLGQIGFAIRDSRDGPARTRIGPDAATCEACLRDLFDSRGRFHHYPFVTCTHCGPRLTVTAGLPYDRARTSLANFPLCAACRQDYEDPSSRRFHAETIACAACGPRLSHDAPEIAAAIASGLVVALKGIGGFHLLCDARNEAAVARLRRGKSREAKPFAIIVANAASLARIAEPTAAEASLAGHPAAPIVLVRPRPGLAASVAPGLAAIGVMLAYAPVHHLIFAALAGGDAGGPWTARAIDAALVATSANPRGEPLVTDDGEARRRLAGLADLVVTHDRPILVRADDSVMRVIDGAPAFLRRARGHVPEPIDLGEDGPDVIAFGGHLKATITLTRGREAFVSQHVGDLDTAGTVRALRETAARWMDLLGVDPEGAASDLHPDFQSSRLAEESGLPLVRVQHHAAHVAAVAAEHRLQGPVLGAALDGHGLGTGGGAWGGELIRIEGPSWRRHGHLAPLPFPGGDRAAREPWRMGLAALARLGQLDARALERFAGQPAAPSVAALLASGRAPETTSLGRHFDAAAALLGLRMVQDYEGQAAMELEALVREPIVMEGGFSLVGCELHVSSLLARLAEGTLDPTEGASLWHGTLAEGLAAWIAAAASAGGHAQVVLGGGCMMNRVLAEALCRSMRHRGVEPLLARALPSNDGGLSLGQAVLARRELARTIVGGPAEEET
jgi:hydrogenase maturation protein HypF